MTVRSGDLSLDSPQKLKALGDPTRAKILRILEDGPASAKQLSAAMSVTHGKVGHHVKVLREAGLIEVVEERRVRAVTEKLYGLTYDRLVMDKGAGDRLEFALAQAAREALPTVHQPFDPPATFLTTRLRADHAREIDEKLKEIAEEVAAADEPGGEPYGLVVSLFRTDTPKVQASWTG